MVENEKHRYMQLMKGWRNSVHCIVLNTSNGWSIGTITEVCGPDVQMKQIEIDWQKATGDWRDRRDFWGEVVQSALKGDTIVLVNNLEEPTPEADSDFLNTLRLVREQIRDEKRKQVRIPAFFVISPYQFNVGEALGRVIQV